jgi:hypothetical protein
MESAEWQREPHFRQYLPKQVYPMFNAGSKFNLGGLPISDVWFVVPITSGIESDSGSNQAVLMSPVQRLHFPWVNTGIGIDNEGLLL